jgi:hypothetical protein
MLFIATAKFAPEHLHFNYKQYIITGEVATAAEPFSQVI